MHIDESSLEGTLSVMDTIFQSTLELTEDDVKTHGLVICAGDQLSLSLLDKVYIPLKLLSVSTYTQPSSRSQPSDVMIVTLWTMWDFICKARMVCFMSSLRKLRWSQMSSGGNQIQNRHGPFGKLTLYLDGKLSLLVGKRSHLHHFIQCTSSCLISHYLLTS